MPGLFPGGGRKDKKSRYSDTGREGRGTVVTEGQCRGTARKEAGRGDEKPTDGKEYP